MNPAAAYTIPSRIAVSTLPNRVLAAPVEEVAGTPGFIPQTRHRHPNIQTLTHRPLFNVHELDS